MPSLPANTTYGNVTGRIVTAVGDTPVDGDRVPDEVAATGTVTFTPKVDLVRNTVAKTVMVPRPVVTYLDGEGYITLSDGVTSFGHDPEGVSLVASDNPDLDPQGWAYTVSFEVAGANGVPLVLPSFDIVILAGVTVDLADVAPSSVSPVVSVAAATALAAQAAASAAAALALVEAATGGGGGSGGGSDLTAMHFRGAYQRPGGEAYYTFDNGIPAGLTFVGDPWTIVDKVDDYTGLTKALKSPTVATVNPFGGAKAVFTLSTPTVVGTAYASVWSDIDPASASVTLAVGSNSYGDAGRGNTRSADLEVTTVAGATTATLTLSRYAAASGDPADDIAYLLSVSIPVADVSYNPGDVVTHNGGVFVRLTPGPGYEEPVNGSAWLQLT